MCLSTSHTCLLPSIFCCSCLGPADIVRVGTAHQSSQWTPTLLRFWIDFELNLNWGLYLRMFSSLWVYEQRKTRVFSQILHKCHFSSQGKIQEIQRIIDTLLVLRKRIVLRIEVNQFESPFKFFLFPSFPLVTFSSQLISAPWHWTDKWPVVVVVRLCSSKDWLEIMPR